MEGKSKFIVLLIIIALLVVGFVVYTQTISQNNKISIDNTSFSLPGGYYEGSSKDNGLNITNGFNSIIIQKFNDNDIKSHINDYKRYKEQSNYTIVISNFDVGNITVYKSNIVNDTSYLNYWFLYNNETYYMHTEDGNKNTDNLISELITSLNNV